MSVFLFLDAPGEAAGATADEGAARFLFMTEGGNATDWRCSPGGYNDDRDGVGENGTGAVAMARLTAVVGIA